MVLGSEGSVSPSEPHHRNGESRTNCAGLLALMSRGWYGGGGVRAAGAPDWEEGIGILHKYFAAT